MRLRANAICQREKTMFEHRSWSQLDGENRSSNDRMDSIFLNITISKSMNNIKIITLFHPHEKTPFMICIVKKVEDTEHGIKLTLENGNDIFVNNYSYYLLSESVSRCDEDRLKNIYIRLVSELSQMSEETIRAMMSYNKANYAFIYFTKRFK